MNFERNIDPYKKLRIGNGRALKILWVSIGAGARMNDESTMAMIKNWQKNKKPPSGVYPIIERRDGTNSFVEPTELSGELIEWKGNYYQLP